MRDRDDDVEHASEHPEEIWAKKVFGLLLHQLDQLPEASRARLQGRFAHELLNETCTVDTPKGKLSFVLLGRTAAGRALNLLTKQPGTIAWIDTFRPGGVFWDVGANVGAYTLYAGLRGDTNVVAFEPAAVNYFLLTANCEANGQTDRVQCLNVGLGAARSISGLEVSQFDPAKSFGFHARPELDEPRVRQATVVLSMDQLVEEYGLAVPTYIKIDAPGMTDAILAGGARLLQRPEVRELHVEVRETTKAGQRILEALVRHGFTVTGRHEHGQTADVTFARR